MVSNVAAYSSLVGVALGLIAHHGFFIHGEWHVQAPEIFVSHIFIPLFFAAGTVLSRYGFESSILPGTVFSAGLLASICYLVTLSTSILVYRVFFHELTKQGFQGPFYLRTSKIWHVWKCRTSKNHLFLDKIHKQYGDFVRTGPQEITVFHPDVFLATDGPKTECGKSDWYDLLFPESSLLTTRNRAVHDERRKDWKTCFSPPALAEHFQKSIKHVSNLDKLLSASVTKQQPVAMRNLCYWLGFDMMGDFVMNSSFGMLETQEWHHMVVRLQKALGLLGPVSPAPWLIQLAFRVFPRVWRIKDWFEMTAWSHVQIDARLKAGWEKQPTPDLVHYLLETKVPEGHKRTQEDLLKMRGDSLNAIVAGSEPIPVVLLGLFAELAQKPEHIDLIYEELRDADITDTKVLNALPHMNAAIQEALRLYTVLPTAGPRKAGPNGVTVAGVFIPPNTTIINPRYSIHRREDCFERANEFIPERWTTRREMVRNMAAYSPWGTAHHSCIARVMAIDALRITCAWIIKKYRFRLAPGESGRRVLEDMIDQLAPNPGHLSLVFEFR
ncbi:cytochrome P450 [Podospora australis]|uniref:Cytochrome P450 n=1 Tax=Podospora australis TaxID=1536484 RepID=A0AAN6WQ26_9PEZI|nr:cytochrome P450 [Podospora australis]